MKKGQIMYTDPGSGLFFAQVVGVAALTVIYRFRRALSSVFGRKQEPESDSGK